VEEEMGARKFISVLIVDHAIESKGILANAALVVGLTAGRELPQSKFGSNVADGEGGFIDISQISGISSGKPGKVK
jgi:hypothetical protein